MDEKFDWFKADLTGLLRQIEERRAAADAIEIHTMLREREGVDKKKMKKRGDSRMLIMMEEGNIDWD